MAQRWKHAQMVPEQDQHGCGMQQSQKRGKVRDEVRETVGDWILLNHVAHGKVLGFYLSHVLKDTLYITTVV